MEIKSNEIRMVQVEQIIANPKNTNKHPPEQIDRLVKILNYQGFREPLVISNRSGFLVCGHGRLEAAKKMGVTELPVIYQDFESEAQEYAHMVADNEIARHAELDKEKLKAELPNLGDLDLDLLGLLDTKFLDEIDVQKIDPAKQDDTPDLPVTPVSKRGDIWLLGRHRVMCGDSCLIDDVEKLLPEKKTDHKIHLITDPPYGISYKPKASQSYGMIKNDDVILDFFPVAKALTNGYVFVWTGYQVVEKWIEKIQESYDRVTNLIIWWKGGGQGDTKRNLAQDYEVALYQEESEDFECGVVNNQGNSLNPKAKRVGAVWQIGKDPTGQYKHPTQKPVALNEKVLEHFTQEGEYVLDLFLGSGGNLIACEKMGRTLRGMELDEKYCDVICQRFFDLTGQEPVLESTGEKYTELKNKVLPKE